MVLYCKWSFGTALLYAILLCCFCSDRPYDTRAFIAFAYLFNYHQLYQYAVTPSINILNISPLNIRMDEELHSQK